MVPTGTTLLIAACLAGAGATKTVGAAQACGFTAFAQDEDVCRQAGTAAIGNNAGASAARRYDFAYRRCMAAQAWVRQGGAAPERGPPGFGDPHSLDYPDAFYSIPYATPGYGYDGFGY